MRRGRRLRLVAAPPGHAPEVDPKVKRSWLAITALVAVVALGWGSVTAARRVGVFQGYAPPQPIAFSHALHAGSGEGGHQIPCLYCHFAAERSRHAGIPPLNVCMNCHGQLKKQTRDLERLKEAVAQNRPIVWVKVHNLPDFVYFNHQQHVVAGGLACQECHGPVETMERIRQEKPLTMGWCIDCHKSHGVTEYSPRQAGRATGAQKPVGGMDCSKCHY